MKEQVSFTRNKIERLKHQLSVTEELAFPYSDSRLAIQALQSKLDAAHALLVRVSGMSPDLQRSTLKDVNITLARVSKIAGIISRAANVRSPFEFYKPLIALCRTLVDAEARLILSAEFDFIPFTYPLSSSELPGFIIIGLPISEAENVLVFPLAGHELGHSVWRRFEIDRYYERDIENHIYRILESRRAELSSNFPEIAKHDDAKPLEESSHATVVAGECAHFVSAQLEEIFSDFLALLLFRESYLYAFRYLVAPAVSQRRYTEYPPTRVRAEMLATYADQAGIVIHPNYPDAFVNESEPWDSSGRFINSVVDEACLAMRDSIYKVAESRLRDLKTKASDAGRDQVKRYFELGIPYDQPTNLGDLVNAAWSIVKANSGADVEIGKVQGLSDLVLKSSELGEFVELFNVE